MNAKSKCLFHFTSSLEYLIGIIEKGFQPRYCLENITFLSIDYLALPMVCFCDIPLSIINGHTKFYGEYGLGMTKEWGIKNKLEPLLYTSKDGSVSKMLNDLHCLKEIMNLNGFDSERKILLKNFKRIAALTKPLSGEMKRNGKIFETDFHQENEWRYIPDNYDFISEENYNIKRQEGKISIPEGAIHYKIKDIKYIFVKMDSEIPKIIDALHEKFKFHDTSDVKILTSKIISLETLNFDL